MPCVPYTPFWLIKLEPDIQIHSPLLYFQRSFSAPWFPTESGPIPPNSQKFPDESVQLIAVCRAPGVFPAAGVPFVPYSPDWRFPENPDIQVHWPLLYSHRSLSKPPDGPLEI